MPKPRARPRIWLPKQMPKYGQLLVQDGAEQLDLGVGRGGVAGAVGHEEAVRVDGLDVLEGGGGGQDVDADAALGEADGGHGLDAEVDRGDAEPGSPSQPWSLGSTT